MVVLLRDANFRIMAANASISSLGRATKEEKDMTWLLLEAGIAGLLLVFIVWWTLPKKKKEHDKTPS
ncbi:hypothetical protein [Chitinimonas lacunae]|uniref:Uncharacterized protein n=1 Tax=Chitinimonas lacunae TaxID=1963018 RepID=A0ABV8MM34_9NEIS